MLLQQGHYVCALCGERVMALADQRPLVMIKGTGGQPNMRVISLEGKELHACPIRRDAK